MDSDRALLNYVYQNAEMGTRTIDKLLGIVEDKEFLRHLEAQKREYSAFEREAGNLLERDGRGAKGLNVLEKMSTYLMIDIQTLTDRSASHVAEMMMVGSNMGVINAVKNLKKYPDANRDTRALMERLLKAEEGNVQQLKKFL
ncbi:hypothetical protein [uncultured Pseudoflavonifractor sp.]|uniref:hypothetical protein n=1 Tax=uncultured Pseudoflavonifractor sp. TaxID=1221379 RepID=UPI0025FFE8C6|nr:hypothetical protein [uncultured Pseudoflavonifractor sp.]